MKRIKKIKCIIILIMTSFFLNNCTNSLSKKSNTWFHINIDKISNLRGDLVQKFTCSETSSNLNKRFSYRVKGVAELHYFFYCKPTAVGRALNMKIYYNDQLIQHLDSVASRVIQEDVEYKVDSWLVDVNEDGFLDLVQRTYSLKDINKDLLRVSIWNHDRKSMVKYKIDSEDEKKYKVKYKVNRND